MDGWMDGCTGQIDRETDRQIERDRSVECSVRTNLDGGQAV